MAKSNERLVVADVLGLSSGDTRLFRNNVGRLQDRNGMWVAYGLCVGSSDLIGAHSVVVTPAMVGKRVALFVALECKDRAPATVEQLRFLSQVQKMGGIAAVVHSRAEAEEVLARAI